MGTQFASELRPDSIGIVVAVCCTPDADSVVYRRGNEVISFPLTNYAGRCIATMTKEELRELHWRLGKFPDLPGTKPADGPVGNEFNLVHIPLDELLESVGELKRGTVQYAQQTGDRA
ncbi:hypothetical protein HYX08_06515 [Candidatus Woesearchaeota archaeon]|nr:hypothetical protein [Candidatus Woesearchaeota archaeon]